MNIIKLGIAFLTMFGVSYGVDHISTNRQEPIIQNTANHCESNELFGHMLQDLSVEDRLLVEAKINELLITYETSEEELLNNFDLRHEFMEELMVFFQDNDFNFEDQHTHMGMN